MRLCAERHCGHQCAHESRYGISLWRERCALPKLGLQNVRGILKEGETDIAYMGELPEEMTTEDFAAHIKEALGLSAVRCTAVSKMLRTVAVVGGAGGDYALAAQAKGADAFVTGEVKHHEAIAAQQAGLALYEAGHYHGAAVPQATKAYLDTACPGVEFIVSEANARRWKRFETEQKGAF